MMSLNQLNLPFYDRFNEAALDDAIFDSVLSGEALAELPSDDVFLVSHRMLRDTPYGSRDYYELTYVLEGRVVARIGNQEVHLLEDSLFLATPPCEHSVQAVDPDAVVVVLCLRPALFASGVFADYLAHDNPVSRTLCGDGDHDFMVFSDTYGRILYRSMRTLLKEYGHAGHAVNFSVLARTLLLLAQLSEIDTYSFYGLDQRMMEVISYLREHCATVSVASLAAHFCYSETYFSQLVHKRCGVRARELIVAARLRRARELLLSSNLSVQDIANSVGYDSYSHFNRIFKQVYHITPAAYRAFAAREVGR